MEKLSDKELSKISAGGLSLGAALGIIAGITFLLGVFDGYVNPKKCN